MQASQQKLQEELHSQSSQHESKASALQDLVHSVRGELKDVTSALTSTQATLGTSSELSLERPFASQPRRFSRCVV